MGCRSVFREVVKCLEEFGLELDLDHVQKIRREVRECQIEVRGCGQKSTMARASSDYQAGG